MTTIRKNAQLISVKTFINLPALPRVGAHIKPVIDDRGEGTDDGAQTCCIHTVQKGGQIIGKRVKDNGSRYVGDDLAQTDPQKYSWPATALVRKCEIVLFAVICDEKTKKQKKVTSRT